tara:strand:+ start:638 stop:853 length:216 start_codon:yes stop_codon:yes gene_type:complete
MMRLQVDYDVIVWLFCAAFNDATSVDAVALLDATVFEKLPPLWMLREHTRFFGYTATDCPLYILQSIILGD